jgi:uncharacterized protein YndB with AHSA1/START domain
MSLSQPDEAAHIEHATLKFERNVPADVEAVFIAFSNSRLRAEWGTPSDKAIVLYDKDEFVEGGEDKYRCGSKENPNIHAVTRYLSIIQNRRIVSSETLVMGGSQLCVSLTTIELIPAGSTTKIKQTTHVASFVGKSMIDGYKQGNNASLDNLVRHFDGEDAA